MRSLPLRARGSRGCARCASRRPRRTAGRHGKEHASRETKTRTRTRLRCPRELARRLIPGCKDAAAGRVTKGPATRISGTGLSRLDVLLIANRRAWRTNARRVSSQVFVSTSIPIRVAYPTPFMSIVFVAGVLGLTPTLVRISVASYAHTMLAIQIAAFVHASYESGSRGSRVTRGRITPCQYPRYGGR